MKVAIKDIAVGERRREDYGDVAGLAESIERYGLIQPVVLDGENRLVAGGRRLQAVKSLGWSEIDARSMGELTEAELRKIEAEENLRRKDLTPYEWSKEMVRKAREAAETISNAALEIDPKDISSTVEEKEPQVISTHCVEKDPRGRKSDYGVPKKDAAQAAGYSASALVNAEQHVAAVDRYPELKPFPQGDARKMARNLDKLPEAEREEKRELVKKGDSKTLTALADRPPIPDMPTPRERAKDSPGKGWIDLAAKVNTLVGGVKKHGGILTVCRGWSRDGKRRLLHEIRQFKADLSAWEEVLEAEVGDE